MDFPLFICHYSKLKERKRHILNEIEKLGGNITPEFIQDYDKEEITPAINAKFFYDDRKEWRRRSAYYMAWDNSRNLKSAEKSIALKHYVALKKIAEGHHPYGMVIEDDCIFCHDFMEKLSRVIEGLPEEWGIYYPNSYTRYAGPINYRWEKLKDILGVRFSVLGSHWKRQFQRPGQIPSHRVIPIMKKPCPARITNNIFLIAQKTCQLMVTEIEKNKIALPIDWEFDWLFHKLKIPVYFNVYKKDRMVITGFMRTSIQKQPIA